MNKSELLENYTAEQLAEMVEQYQNAFDALKFSDNIAKTGIFENAMYAAAEARLNVSQYENERLKRELDRSQITITQIDEILEELFGVKHDAVEYGEFEQFLRDKVTEKVADFLPTEPIKIADMLISATHTREKSLMEKTFSKAAFGNNDDTIAENVYSVSELRQIAEHLLVYCKGNESEE